MTTRMASQVNVGEGRGEAPLAVECAEPPTLYFPSCGVLCDAFWWARRRRPATSPGAGTNGDLATRRQGLAAQVRAGEHRRIKNVEENRRSVVSETLKRAERRDSLAVTAQQSDGSVKTAVSEPHGSVRGELLSNVVDRPAMIRRLPLVDYQLTE